MKRRILALLCFMSLCLSLQALPRIKSIKIIVDTPVEYVYKNNATNEKEVYWVITARLENQTQRNRNVALSVKLMSDYKRPDQEYQMIECESFKAIQKMVEAKNDKKYVDYIDMSKKTFKHGEVRDAIFIFKRPSRYSNNLTLYVEGLSNVKIQRVKANPGTLDRLSLQKASEDFYSVATPRVLKIKKDDGKEIEERRFKKVQATDYDGYEDKQVKTYLIYKRSFVRKGDEFHVHEDDIKKKKNELNQWILMVDEVLPGFPEKE